MPSQTQQLNQSAEFSFLQSIWLAAGGDLADLERVEFVGQGALASAYAVTPFAAASMAAAGLAAASLRRAQGGQLPAAAPWVRVDRRLASFWFLSSIRPQGWQVPPVWDAVAGDYACADGWIRLHTNAPHHRRAALAVLGLDNASADRTVVENKVANWSADALEGAVVAAGGCAGAMRSWSSWQAHPQGRAVLAEPLLHMERTANCPRQDWAFAPHRPLQGIRVLDLTRVLAGPIATRLLAGLGADVLRIDPPWWDEAAVVPEVTLGKRCARLDLRQPQDRACFESLLQGADVLVHGYRSDALETLGLGAAQRQQLRLGLIDISLDAYGFSGPWSQRRGFDSIVQMSMGIAQAGKEAVAADRPVPLPVQALDHATGYVLATAALRGLEQRLRVGRGLSARASLARTGGLLASAGLVSKADFQALAPETQMDWAREVEKTSWGDARRLQWPMQIANVNMHWALSACALGSSTAAWVGE